MLRVVAHVACWLPFIIGPVRLIQHGWQPVGDEAAIALRSWNALTNHGPLVGQATRLAHGVFDPGPLQYWLLSIPVHLNPVYGMLWGGMFWCIVACSLTVEAAWAVRGEIAGLAASGLILVLLLWIPGVAVMLTWNPWFGMTYFLAAFAAAWAVIAGHRRWWPVLVITASVAAQAHLMFTLGSAALVLLALIVGIADSIRARAGYWWVLIGLVAGAACWSAPAYQQFTMPDGNIAALINSTGGDGNGARTGVSFGLKALTSAIQPIPLWWKPSLPSIAIYHQISARSSGYAIAALILLAVVGIAAIWPLRCRWLAAFAAISLLLSLAALVTYSNVPVHYTSLRTLNYLIIMVFPVGALTWLVIGCGVGMTILVAANRALGAAPQASPSGAAQRAARAKGKARAGPVAASTAAAGAADPASPATTATAAASMPTAMATAGPADTATAGPAAADPADPATAVAAVSAGPASPAALDGHTGPSAPTGWDAFGAAASPAPPAGARPGRGVTGWPARGLDWMVGGVRDWTSNGLRAGVAAAVAGWVILLTVLVVSGQPPDVRAITADPVMRVAPVAARQIEDALPPQQVAMTIRDYHDPGALQRLALGVSWALTPPGYHPEIMQTRLARELGDRYVFRGEQIPLVTVVVRQHSVHTVLTPWTPPRLNGLGVTRHDRVVKHDLTKHKKIRHRHHRHRHHGR